jgi:hypothetical protein
MGLVTLPERGRPPSGAGRYAPSLMRNLAYVQIAQVVLILWHLRARSVTPNVIAPALGGLTGRGPECG